MAELMAKSDARRGREVVADLPGERVWKRPAVAEFFGVEEVPETIDGTGDIRSIRVGPKIRAAGVTSEIGQPCPKF